MGHAEAEAGAMLLACRLAGLSALGKHYAGVNRRAQCGALCGPAWSPRSDGGEKSEDWQETAKLSLLSRYIVGQFIPLCPNTGVQGPRPYMTVQIGQAIMPEMENRQ